MRGRVGVHAGGLWEAILWSSGKMKPEAQWRLENVGGGKGMGKPGREAAHVK